MITVLINGLKHSQKRALFDIKILWLRRVHGDYDQSSDDGRGRLHLLTFSNSSSSNVRSTNLAEDEEVEVLEVLLLVTTVVELLGMGTATAVVEVHVPPVAELNPPMRTSTCTWCPPIIARDDS